MNDKPGDHPRDIGADYWYFPDDWDATYPPSEWDQIVTRVHDEGAGRIIEIGRLVTLPNLYAAEIPLTFDENGDPDETEVRLFQSERAAQEAIERAFVTSDPMTYIRRWTIVDPVTDCWNWQRAVATNGYGQVRWRGAGMRAHRLAWELAHGPIPEGFVIMHKCDNKLCCNPNHLAIGTQLENMRDYHAGRNVERT